MAAIFPPSHKNLAICIDFFSLKRGSVRQFTKNSAARKLCGNSLPCSREHTVCGWSGHPGSYMPRDLPFFATVARPTTGYLVFSGSNSLQARPMSVCSHRVSRFTERLRLSLHKFSRVLRLIDVGTSVDHKSGACTDNVEARQGNQGTLRCQNTRVA